MDGGIYGKQEQGGFLRELVQDLVYFSGLFPGGCIAAVGKDSTHPPRATCHSRPRYCHAGGMYMQTN